MGTESDHQLTAHVNADCTGIPHRKTKNKTAEEFQVSVKMLVILGVRLVKAIVMNRTSHV
jgi:hypothetical protein